MNWSLEIVDKIIDYYVHDWRSYSNAQLISKYFYEKISSSDECFWRVVINEMDYGPPKGNNTVNICK